jgi:hypothetical protein
MSIFYGGEFLWGKNWIFCLWAEPKPMGFEVTFPKSKFGNVTFPNRHVSIDLSKKIDTNMKGTIRSIFLQGDISKFKI